MVVGKGDLLNQLKTPLNVVEPGSNFPRLHQRIKLCWPGLFNGNIMNFSFGVWGCCKSEALIKFHSSFNNK